MSTNSFMRCVRLPASAEEAYRWHVRPGALLRLLPPWEDVRVTKPGDVADGARVELSMPFGPFRFRWMAEHGDCQPGRQFRDTALSGPFARWDHLHRFVPDGERACWLEDRIEYALPFGPLGSLLGDTMARARLDRMFRYRHETTAGDLALHARHADQPRWDVGITGGSGLIGSALAPLLTTGGHRAVSVPRNREGGEPFDTSSVRAALARFAERGEGNTADSPLAIVHLAGEPIAAGRWTAEKKAKIRESRVQGTRSLCQAMAGLERPPEVIVCASAVGFYGSRGGQILDEQDAAGDGFLASVVRDWEAAVEPALARGVRVVLLRFGIILTPRGGALARMLLPFQTGLGGRIGSGEQYWSWVSIDDVLGAIVHAIMTESLAGPVNVTAPHPETNAAFTKALGNVLHRPAYMPVPAAVAETVLGEMANELLLSSARVMPTRLLETGYTFRHAHLVEALRHLLGRAP